MDTKAWYAWINLMPPKPYELHAVGDVRVGNPGVIVELRPREPQGANPAILLLDLHLVDRPGMWPQVMSWVQCRYDRVLVPSDAFTDVEIMSGGTSIARVTVDQVH